MATIEEVITLETERCITCGIIFAVPDWYQTRRLEDHVDFSCPNGHWQHYSGKTDAQKLKEQLAYTQKALEQERKQHDTTRKGLDETRKELTTTKGQLTKARKRAVAGACPCCNRTFVQLARHMACKHPEFVQEARE